MDNLTSGLVGALLATVITVIYSHISELIRRRYEIALGVVGYSDDIYNLLHTMQAYKNKKIEEKGEVELDEYRTASKQLRILVLSGRIHARAALVYGENSPELEALQKLRIHFIESARLLWNSDKDNWNEAKAKLFSRFDQEIDPLRLATEIQYIRSVRIQNILKDWILKLWIFKTVKKKKPTEIG